MRGLGVATVFASLGVLAFACGVDGDPIGDPGGSSSSSSGDASGDSISSVPSTAGDASDDANNNADAEQPPKDADVSDANTSDATVDGGGGDTDSGDVDEAIPGAPVTVSINSIDGPEANVVVVFSDVNGALLETVMTGPDGKASSSTLGVNAPAMASALVTSFRARNIVTWTNTKGGDVLKLFGIVDDANLGIYDVTLPGDYADAGATKYEGRTGDCTSGLQNPPSLHFTLGRVCVSNQNSGIEPVAPLLAIARRPDGVPVGFAFQKGNTIPMNNGTLSVSPNNWQPPAPFTVNVLHAPNPLVVLAEVTEIADGLAFHHSGSPVDNTGSTVFTRAVGFADSLESSIAFGNNGVRRSILTRFPPAASMTFDADTALPAITGGSINATSPQRPMITWAGSTTNTDGGLVQISFKGTPLPGSDAATFHWTFVVKPDTNTVMAPAMPAGSGEFIPDGTGLFLNLPYVAFFDFDSMPSFRTFRQTEGVILGLPADLSALSIPPLAADGTVRTTSFAQ